MNLSINLSISIYIEGIYQPYYLIIYQPVVAQCVIFGLQRHVYQSAFQVSFLIWQWFSISLKCEINLRNEARINVALVN